MKSRILSLMAVALVAGLVTAGAATPAHAIPVSYITSGTFDSGLLAGTPTYSNAAGVNITFNGTSNGPIDVPPPSSVTFGTFDSSASTNTSFAGVSSGFTLNIFQTSPVVGGPLVFVGTLQGQLKVSNSQAFVQFAAPLSQKLVLTDPVSGNIFTTIYSIVSADGPIPGTPGPLGRVNISPKNANAGISSIAGSINASVVPEPSTLLSAGLAVPALVLLYRRKKARAAA
jgi:hypothetical protein